MQRRGDVRDSMFNVLTSPTLGGTCILAHVPTVIRRGYANPPNIMAYFWTVSWRSRSALIRDGLFQCQCLASLPARRPRSIAHAGLGGFEIRAIDSA